MTFPQQAFSAAAAAMKFTDKHLNGREKGSIFLSTGLRGVGLTLWYFTVDVLILKKGKLLCI